MGSSDVSSVTKYFPTPAEGFSTTLASTITAGASTITLNNTAGLVDNTVFVGIIEPGATAQQAFTGTVNIGSTQITNVVWTRGTNVGHASGVTIVDYVTGTALKMISTGVLKQHTQAGAHTAITTDTITVASGSTLPAGDIGTADIANSAITTALINNASVTADKLSTGGSTALVATGETTTNTTYVALATTGPAVTVTIGANGLALVTLFSKFGQDTQGKRAFMGFDISGATTLAAADNYAVEFQGWLANTDAAYSATFLLTGLAAGSTTFTAKYRVDANTGTFTNRRIGVVPL